MRNVLDVLPSAVTLMAFSLVALGIVLSPGPNMMYLVSRSVTQGRRAGYISLLGVATGFLCYLLLTCLGLAGIFVAVPLAYLGLKWAGVAYLLYLPWQAVRSSSTPLFAPSVLSPAWPDVSSRWAWSPISSI